MQRFYLIPIEQFGNYRGPKYFVWRYNSTGINCVWSMMDYGFMPEALLLAQDITLLDDAALMTNPDVYGFPTTGLDLAISGTDPIKTFCEGVNIPTDWTTATTTYLQLLRILAGMFQFAQRYAGISGQALLGGTVTLATRYRDLSPQQQTWFDATIQSFGYNLSPNPNNTFRQMLKSAGDAWGSQPFIMGGVSF